ncbi:MAG: mannose-6-phosphate isomerase [Thermomicrobiales bacterium]|nr:mannose-6-phosphate isomerase [Thermomicrobiales bacterium]
MTAKGPLVVSPRLDAKPWGGRRLEAFGFGLPPDQAIGEAIVTAPDAVVEGGVQLSQIVGERPEAALGERGLAATGEKVTFTLLVKLIDANEDLSIQVHPDDAAAAREGDGQSLGKTEAWWVLDADPGSALYLGLRPGVTLDDLATASRGGTGAAHLMRRVSAQPNTLVFLPAGTVHALGAGVLVYEIQQPSAITYRLDDWGRVDAAGRPRELHVEQGLAVADASSRPEPIPPVTLPSASGRRQLLVACPYFALERIALVAGEEVGLVAAESPQTVTCLQGTAQVTADGRTVALQAGQTAVLLADAAGAAMRADSPTVALRAWVPDESTIRMMADRQPSA